MVWNSFPLCRKMNYDFQNEMEPWSCFIFVLETSEKVWIKVYRKLFPPSLQLSFLESHTHFSIFTFRPGPVSKCEAEEFLHSYICESQTELKGLASLPPFSSQTAYFHHSAQLKLETTWVSLLWKSSEGTFTTPNERLQRRAEIKSAEFMICLGAEPNSVYNARSMPESQHQVGLGCPPCALWEPSSAFVYFRHCLIQCSGKPPSFSVIWGRKMLSMPFALKGMTSLIYKLGWRGGGMRAELPSPSCCLSDAGLVLLLLSAASVRSQCAGIAQKVKICWLNFLQLPTQKAS